MSQFTKSGMIVDLLSRTIFPGTITVAQGRIKTIREDRETKSTSYILPGFIDAHIHIESTMLIPSEFARLASVHGTVATVSDPHEIGNILGLAGVRYMIQNGGQVPFHFYFGAPSCVPATKFETSGAEITAKDIETLFKEDKLKYLSEMMNYPGVLSQDPEVMLKIQVARALGKRIDGHAPGLRDSQAKKYISAGISTDHECYRLAEALEKAENGMHILIREGSAAKNYEALHPLLKSHPEKVMFCSDDKHSYELVKGHINDLVKRSIVEKGYDLMDVLRAACLNPILHYDLDIGILRQNDSADFIIVDNLQNFTVLETYVKGILISKNGETLIPRMKAETPNNFHVSLKKPDDFKTLATTNKINLIKAEDGQLITRESNVEAKISKGLYVPDITRDILKIAVVNRYKNVTPATAFIHNFGLKNGAIASSVAHDSHNIIVIGCDDEAICKAVNALIENKGGIAIVNDQTHLLSLPVAGIMSNEDGYAVAQKHEAMDTLVREMGCSFQAPFMTLSFMALLVIPELKLSDKGLFDVQKFAFVDLAI